MSFPLLSGKTRLIKCYLVRRLIAFFHFKDHQSTVAYQFPYFLMKRLNDTLACFMDVHDFNLNQVKTSNTVMVFQLLSEMHALKRVKWEFAGWNGTTL